MADLVHGLAEEQVADQAVAVRADDEQVDRLAPELADELPGAVGAVEQDRAGLVALVARGPGRPRQVALVGVGLAVGGLGAVDPGHRRVDDVEQDQLGLARARPGSGPG